MYDFTCFIILPDVYIAKRGGGLFHQYQNCFHKSRVGPTRRAFFAQAFSLEVTCGSVPSQGFLGGGQIGVRRSGGASFTDSVSEPANLKD